MASQDTTPYWLFAWLKSRNAKTVLDIRAELSGQSSLRELRDVAARWAESAGQPPTELNLVAGSGIRLDDALSCPSPTCRRLQVDVLFRHAWHYFDRILLPDGAGDLLLNPPPEWDHQYQLEVLLGLMDTALHIQRLGASDLVHYYPSRKPSSHMLDDLLRYRGNEWKNAWQDVEASLAKARCQVERVEGGRFLVKISDPSLQVTTTVPIQLEEGDSDTEEFLRAQAAHQVMHLHMVDFEHDVVTARRLGGSLASTVWSHAHVLSALSKVPDSSAVLFHLSFPSLKNVPIQELISIRLAEGDAFLAFRNALVRAAREMAEDRAVSDPQAVADQILRDVVEPEVARLRKRLNSAKRALAGKCAVSVGLAAIGTLCGLQWVALPATAAVAGISSAVSQYLEENKAVEVSDMFFLWKALQHAE